MQKEKLFEWPSLLLRLVFQWVRNATQIYAPFQKRFSLIVVANKNRTHCLPMFWSTPKTTHQFLSLRSSLFTRPLRESNPWTTNFGLFNDQQVMMSCRNLTVTVKFKVTDPNQNRKLRQKDLKLLGQWLLWCFWHSFKTKQRTRVRIQSSAVFILTFIIYCYLQVLKRLKNKTRLGTAHSKKDEKNLTCRLLVWQKLTARFPNRFWTQSKAQELKMLFSDPYGESFCKFRWKQDFGMLARNSKSAQV